MMNLNNSNYKNLSNNFILPKYNRDEIKTGIVHFGPGAFHRGHQAFFIDKILSDNPNFGICEISLHSYSVLEKLKPQDFLYSIEIIDKVKQNIIIGAITKILVAPNNPQAVINELANENVKIISSTITEKGYYIENNCLNLEAYEISHDLKNLDNPKSFFGFITAGLLERYKKNLPPFTIIVCDNLLQNGKTCKKALIDFVKIAAPSLLDYVESINCPSSMVDSITPASDEVLLDNFSSLTGLKDNWPIAREKFCQWVIEDFPNDYGIDWKKYGIEITTNISQYENAKLRILNAAHSNIAYLGILRGYKNVFSAWNDYEIQSDVKTMVFQEIIPNLAADFDIEKYANDVFDRFNNPSINHLLSQIAWDGSKKIPIRIISSIIDALKNKTEYENLAKALSSYMAFIYISIKTKQKITDPLSDLFEKIIMENNTINQVFEKLLAIKAIFPETIISNKKFITILKEKYNQLIESYHLQGAENEKTV